MRTFYNYRVMRQWSSLQPNYKASKFSKVILIIQMPKKKKLELTPEVGAFQ